jgi:bacterioferritin-associated ferredoxin
MIVCHCAGVTDTKIFELIRDGASSVAEISRRCGAGSCCQSCHKDIACMIYATTAAARQPEQTGNTEHATV